MEGKKAEGGILGFAQLGAGKKIKKEAGKGGGKERKWRGGMK